MNNALTMHRPRLLPGTVNARVSFVDPTLPGIWAANSQPKSVGQLVALCDDYGNFVRDLDVISNVTVKVDPPSGLTTDISWYSTNWYISIRATARQAGLYDLRAFYLDEEMRVKDMDGFSAGLLSDVRPRSIKNFTFSGR
jgi:hypothetical protein